MKQWFTRHQAKAIPFSFGIFFLLMVLGGMVIIHEISDLSYKSNQQDQVITELSKNLDTSRSQLTDHGIKPSAPPAAQIIKSIPGAQGPQGSPGAQGQPGSVGASGAPGKVGATGPPGVPGATVTGPPGAMGSPGAQGSPGTTGEQGAVGPQGPQGDKGDKGDDGATGPAGPTGPEGPAGPTCPDGYSLQQFTAVDINGSIATFIGCEQNPVSSAKHASSTAHTASDNKRRNGSGNGAPPPMTGTYYLPNRRYV